MDVLADLRACVSKNKPIAFKGADNTDTDALHEITHIVLNGREYDRATLTAFKDNTSGEYYPLDAIYFAYLKREASHAEYFAECQKLRIKSVSLLHKRPLFDYLTGAIKESPYIDTNFRLDSAAGSMP
jgi:hypothetical protein